MRHFKCNSLWVFCKYVFFFMSGISQTRLVGSWPRAGRRKHKRSSWGQPGSTGGRYRRIFWKRYKSFFFNFLTPVNPDLHLYIYIYLQVLSPFSGGDRAHLQKRKHVRHLPDVLFKKAHTHHGIYLVRICFPLSAMLYCQPLIALFLTWLSPVSDSQVLNVPAVLRAEPECWQLWREHLPHAVYIWPRGNSCRPDRFCSEWTFGQEVESIGLHGFRGCCVPFGPRHPNRYRESL